MAGSPSGTEENGLRREIQIGARSHDHRIVSAKFEQRAAEPSRHPRSDVTTHFRRTGRRYQRHAFVFGKRDAGFPIAGDDLMQVLRSSEFVRDAVEQCRGRKRGEWCFFRWLPNDAVAADEGERGIPRPNCSRKIKSRDDRDHAERMPEFSQRMVRALRYDRSAVELAGQPHRVVADVNHLLNFAETFRANLADLQRDEVREIGLVLAQFVSETADEFSPAWRGRLTPAEKSLARFADGALRRVSSA